MHVKLIINSDSKIKTPCYNYLVEKYKREKNQLIKNHDKLDDKK